MAKGRSFGSSLIHYEHNNSQEGLTSLRGERMKGWVSKEEKWKVKEEVEAGAARKGEWEYCCIMLNIILMMSG